MKRFIGFAIVLVTLFISGSAFAEDLTFEVNGKKYEAAKQDLYGYNTWKDAKAACEGSVELYAFYKGWSLPSIDELNAMYEQLHKKGVGGFADYYYWSSSERDEDNVWVKHFSLSLEANETSNFSGKWEYPYSTFRARCVRAL